MSILRSLAKIKETRGNAKTKNISCDVDLTNDDLQKEDYSFTQPSNSETALSVLDHGCASSERNVSNKRGKYIKYSGTNWEVCVRVQRSKHVTKRQRQISSA